MTLWKWDLARVKVKIKLLYTTPWMWCILDWTRNIQCDFDLNQNSITAQLFIYILERQPNCVLMKGDKSCTIRPGTSTKSRSSSCYRETSNYFHKPIRFSSTAITSAALLTDKSQSTTHIHALTNPPGAYTHTHTHTDVWQLFRSVLIALTFVRGHMIMC